MGTNLMVFSNLGSDLTPWFIGRAANGIFSKLTAKNSLALPASQDETSSKKQRVTLPDLHHPLFHSLLPCPFIIASCSLLCYA